eukprot:tig00021127_g18725.t1
MSASKKEDYTVIKQLGKGSFGAALLVRCVKDGKKYVLKRIEINASNPKERQAAELEAKLLSQLKHPNIVSYTDSFFEKKNVLCIVMTFCEGGDLYNRIKNRRGQFFSEDEILDWFTQMAAALGYIHERHILHRDLKTQNIFLTEKNVVKLGDFGIAKVLHGTMDMARTVIGTPYYMSPEVFSNRPYSFKSDIWALGCVLYEMVTLRHAFDARDMNGLVMKILKSSLPPLPGHYSKELRALVQEMLSKAPEKRPKISDILSRPFIVRRMEKFVTENTVNLAKAGPALALSPPSNLLAPPAPPQAPSPGAPPAPAVPPAVSPVAGPVQPPIVAKHNEAPRKENLNAKRAELQKAEVERQRVESALKKLEEERDKRLQKKRGAAGKPPPPPPPPPLLARPQGNAENALEAARRRRVAAEEALKAAAKPAPSPPCPRPAPAPAEPPSPPRPIPKPSPARPRRPSPPRPAAPQPQRPAALAPPRPRPARASPAAEPSAPPAAPAQPPSSPAPCFPLRGARRPAAAESPIPRPPPRASPSNAPAAPAAPAAPQPAAAAGRAPSPTPAPPPAPQRSASPVVAGAREKAAAAPARSSKERDPSREPGAIGSVLAEAKEQREAREARDAQRAAAAAAAAAPAPAAAVAGRTPRDERPLLGAPAPRVADANRSPNAGRPEPAAAAAAAAAAAPWRGGGRCGRRSGRCRWAGGGAGPSKSEYRSVQAELQAMGANPAKEDPFAKKPLLPARPRAPTPAPASGSWRRALRRRPLGRPRRPLAAEAAAAGPRGARLGRQQPAGDAASAAELGGPGEPVSGDAPGAGHAHAASDTEQAVARRRPPLHAGLDAPEGSGLETAGPAPKQGRRAGSIPSSSSRSGASSSSGRPTHAGEFPVRAAVGFSSEEESSGEEEEAVRFREELAAQTARVNELRRMLAAEAETEAEAGDSEEERALREREEEEELKQVLEIFRDRLQRRPDVEDSAAHGPFREEDEWEEEAGGDEAGGAELAAAFLGGNLRERVEALRQECVEGLGRALFERAYGYLRGKQAVSAANDLDADAEICAVLVGMIGQENVAAFWHKLDSLIFMEDSLVPPESSLHRIPTYMAAGVGPIP